VKGLLQPAVQTQRSGPIRPDELMNHPGTTPVLPRPDDGVSASPAIALKKLLVPVDFSAASWPQLHFSKVIARQFHAQMDIVHVVEPPAYPEWGYAHLPVREEKLRRDAVAHLPQFIAENCIEPDLVDSSSVRTGSAEFEIVRMAAERNSDLIVMASHGYGKALLGSTTERVVRHASCPVLVVRDRTLQENPSLLVKVAMKRILVATDFSELSRKALPYAAAFSKRFGAEIILVHVVPGTLPAELSHLGLVLEHNRLVKGAQDLLPLFRERYLDPQAPVQSRVLTGGPASEICKLAAELDCDLIILSTHGHSGLKHLFLGSVAERVVRHAPCPVLVVRQKERDFVPV
jgi:universal stress protein A